MMLVTITGAGGFLGHHLTSYLKISGFSVTPVSRRSIPEMIKVKDYSQTPGDQTVIHLGEEPDRERANSLGESYNLSPEVISNKKSLIKFIRGDLSSPLCSGWRAELFNKEKLNAK